MIVRCGTPEVDVDYFADVKVAPMKRRSAFRGTTIRVYCENRTLVRDDNSSFVWYKVVHGDGYIHLSADHGNNCEICLAIRIGVGYAKHLSIFLQAYVP